MSLDDVTYVKCFFCVFTYFMGLRTLFLFFLFVCTCCVRLCDVISLRRWSLLVRGSSRWFWKTNCNSVRKYPYIEWRNVVDHPHLMWTLHHDSNRIYVINRKSHWCCGLWFARDHILGRSNCDALIYIDLFIQRETLHR